MIFRSNGAESLKWYVRGEEAGLEACLAILSPDIYDLLQRRERKRKRKAFIP